MANPQIENGYTKISNELLEAICKTKLSDYEHRVFMMIIRKTYGYNKKEDWISLKQLSDETEIKLPHISRTIKKLSQKEMIIKKNRKVGVQKDYDKWLPKQVTNKVTQTGNITQTGNNKKVTNSGNKVTQTGNKKLPKQVDTKEKKETIQKKYIYDILNYWNSKKIIVHKVTDDLVESVKKIIKKKKYKKEDIYKAIENYNTVLKDDKYFFKYIWSLENFLSRKKTLPSFLEGGENWENYKLKNKEKIFIDEAITREKEWQKKKEEPISKRTKETMIETCRILAKNNPKYRDKLKKLEGSKE